tara:strand:+ start:355 stop:546 length:192 start_codon:yes stop_codon:yes gene_type:complete
METTTDNYLTVCDQYCDGDINLEEAVELIMGFSVLGEEIITGLLQEMTRENVVPFVKKGGENV